MSRDALHATTSRLARRLALVGLALSAALGRAATAHAQVDPRGDVRTIPTAHFRVHYRSDGDSAVRAAAETLARKAAGIAEFAYARLAGELVPPPGVVDLLLADNVDFSNGFAQVFPSNRIVVYLVPPVAAVELRQYDDWLQLVITHELAHIFHLDRARGLWAIGRALFGRNPALFPNDFTPSWVKEGLAVYYESAFTGSGRLNAPETRAVPFAAARDGVVPPKSRWSLATSRFPRGTTAYDYGTLMMGQAALAGGDSGMRRFVEATAIHPLPFRLNRASRIGFGAPFSALFDSLDFNRPAWRERLDTTGDARWQMLATDAWYAESPRWLSADSVLWSASNGRDVAGAFVADVRRPGTARRLARRNALDVNVPMRTPAGRSAILYSQTEQRDPYVQRSDLWIADGNGERRLTDGARLIQPDVRADGGIVAVQLAPAHTRLVRVDATGHVRVLGPDAAAHAWAEPRWSPDGTRIAAVQLLPTGEQRIVVLDTLGAIQSIVTGAAAVFASPSFTPDGRRLVWASNRSGRMQLETASMASDVAGGDTTSWRDVRVGVRSASAVSTGVYQPSVSPDGRRVVALLFRADGYHVAVAPLDTTGPTVRSDARAVRAPIVLPGVAAASRGYGAVRQLLPRYWLPIVGQGRLNEATYGASSSGVDILGRHAWVATAAVNPGRREWDASAAYRYAGLGVPVFDLSWSQAWDATFLAVDRTNAVLGSIARRRRFATLSGTVARPRVRRSLSATLGAQYEMRDFTATVDSLLGGPNALLRRGTRYPQLFANASLSTVRRGVAAIAYEEGYTLTSSTSYRWREDAPSLGSWRSVATGRGYLPLSLPGFARHVLTFRGAAGVADTKTATEFSVGGVSGVSTDLLPGLSVGDPARTFPVRGVPRDAQRGIRALGGTVEYRAPLVLLRRAPSPFSFFADRLSLTLFSDAARAWCPGALAAQETSVGLCERPGTRDGWLASAGAELVLDAALQYDVPYRFRFGVAGPYAAPAGIARKGAVYVSLGSYF